ncbi:hypothetical protein CRUP_016463 [Coryphaenoides rupestris]|nr:hypothetical protein CRUP_016463 [Coryphaenoides rupestris]
MFDWVDILESKLDSMPPVGTDVDTVKQQLADLKASLLLKKVTEETDRSAIQEPMSELKMLWDNLDDKIITRQVLENDVLAHKTTVETVRRAGGELVESSAGEEASTLQTKLDHLNHRWTLVLEKTGQRRQQLESALLQAQGFHGEIEDMQQWLKDTERQLLASKAVGGLPDTAREQLNAHLELCSALEVKEELYNTLVTKGQQLLTLGPEGLDSNTEQDLDNLRLKWEAVQAKVAERKEKQSPLAMLDA